MHNKTKNTVKNVVSTANNVNSAAANTNAASAATNAANAAAAADEFNAAHSNAIATNNVFNALQVANPLQNSVLTLQQAQQLTTIAENVATAAAEKAAAKAAKAVKKQKQTAAYILFLHNLITANAYTAKQIVAMCAQQFTTVKLSTIQTTVTDAKNAKYTRFNAVAVCNEQTKILSFANTAATTTTATTEN